MLPDCTLSHIPTVTLLPTNTLAAETAATEAGLARQYFGQREMRLDEQGRLTGLDLGNSGLTDVLLE